MRPISWYNGATYSADDELGLRSDRPSGFFCVWLPSLIVLACFGTGLWWLLHNDNYAGETTASPLHKIVQRQFAPFDLSAASIPVQEIRSGGSPKDGIPALSKPRTIPAGEADFLKDQDRVVGVTLGDTARAYPVAILNYHEVVNDTLQDTPIAVTYCPLCDSAVVFDRRTRNGEREFGVSGLLYNSNVLMYDRSDQESLWSQVKGQAVSGPAVGETLQVLPMELTTWKSWSTRYPESDVLSTETGYGVNYRKNPYAGYFRHGQLMFPARPVHQGLPLKERVLGVWDDDVAVAFPISSFPKNRRGGETAVEREVNGKRITLSADSTTQTIRVVSAEGDLRWLNSLWFAWYAFRPHTQVAR